MGQIILQFSPRWVWNVKSASETSPWEKRHTAKSQHGELGWQSLLLSETEDDSQGIIPSYWENWHFLRFLSHACKLLQGDGEWESWGKEVQINSQDFLKYVIFFFIAYWGLQKMWTVADPLGFTHTSKILKQQGVTYLKSKLVFSGVKWLRRYSIGLGLMWSELCLCLNEGCFESSPM